MVEKVPVMVIKRSGIRERFDRKKVFDGLLKSCEKRAISLDQIEKMVDRIEAKVQNSLDKEVSSLAVGEYSMQVLREVDEVAYIRFAAVYREFKDIRDLMKELEMFHQK
jgi:transcriptional repressor NrdR